MNIRFLIFAFSNGIFNNIFSKQYDYNKLSSEEERIIIHKGTEAPFSGEFYQHTESGTYHCKRCNQALYNSGDKFDSHCGWPSFDDEIEGAVERHTDADGRRTEIVCANCGGIWGMFSLAKVLHLKYPTLCKLFKPFV